MNHLKKQKFPKWHQSGGRGSVSAHLRGLSTWWPCFYHHCDTETFPSAPLTENKTVEAFTFLRSSTECFVFTSKNTMTCTLDESSTFIQSYHLSYHITDKATSHCIVRQVRQDADMPILPRQIYCQSWSVNIRSAEKLPSTHQADT